MLSSGLVKPVREIMTTVDILNITDTTPTIAIFCNIVIFLFKANIEASAKHPKLKPILYKLPVSFN